MPATTQLVTRIDPGTRDGEPDLARQHVDLAARIGHFFSAWRTHGEGKRSARSASERISGDIADVPSAHRVLAVAFLLRAIARDALGDPDAAGRALQRALDLAEPDLVMFPFPVQATPDLPGHHARPGLISETAPGQPSYHREALTYGETRVLHYLPTNLSAREIADELYLSVNTVKTHQRHLYQKLDARSRSQAVARARTLGLLAPSSRRRCQ